MDAKELIENLQESLGNINASRQAHQQILQILQSYKQKLEQEENELDGQ